MKSTITVEISPGELLDKITVLEVKKERIDSAEKPHNISTELGVLEAARCRAIRPSAELDRLMADLKEANAALFDIISRIYECEKAADFGGDFVALARSVYRENDRRALAKRRINVLLGSRLVEEKAHL